MAGTVLGGREAAAKNKQNHGDDFYAVIGAKGGRAGHTGGFAANRKLARIAGRKGGRASAATGVIKGWNAMTPKTQERVRKARRASMLNRHRSFKEERDRAIAEHKRQNALTQGASTSQ